MTLDLEIEKGLIEKAKELRLATLNLAVETGEAHLGGSFSEVEILVSLYHHILKQEDIFILSKGHACYPLYVLLREKGYNPKISGHPDVDVKNGIFCTSGSLGHGLPIGAGIAFAKKLKQEAGKIYILVGDGECQEGTLWETSLISTRYNLDNLILIIDNNNVQGSNHLENILPLSKDLKKTLEYLGWYSLEIQGHSFPEIISAFEEDNPGKPKLIIAHTVKGKGVSFMENDPRWHGGIPRGKQLTQAYKELE